jgi:hypothetical protein
MQHGSHAIATALASGASSAWVSRGATWARENTVWEEDDDQFPMWRYLYYAVRGHVQFRPVMFCGPLAIPDVLLIFGGTGEAFNPTAPVSVGGGLDHELADQTRRIPAKWAPRAVFFSPRAEDRNVTVQSWTKAEGHIRSVTAPFEQTLELVGTWIDEWAKTETTSSTRIAGPEEGDEPSELSTGPILSIGDLVHLDLVDAIPAIAGQAFEPLLTYIDRVLESDVIADRSTIAGLERDRESIHRDLYENPDYADVAVLLTVTNRVLRVLTPFAAPENMPLLEALAATASTPKPDQADAIAAADELADAIAASGTVDPGGQSIYEWLAARLGWYRTVATQQVRSGLPQVGPGLVGVATGADILHLLGMSGQGAVLVATYVMTLVLLWRPVDGQHPDGAL